MDVRHRKLFKDRDSFNWSDLQFIEDLIRKHNLKLIVEYGSGCSTVVIADTLCDMEQGWLWSVESDPVWFDKNQKMLGIHPCAHIIPSPAYVRRIDELPVYEYAWYPPCTPDLVYVDGPELIDARITLNGMRITPPLILVDGREETVSFYQNYLSPYYTWKTEDDRTLFTRRYLAEPGTA